MSSNKWNQSDTAILIEDQAAGGRPIETARKLGLSVGFVFLKAASLRRPFQGYGQSSQARLPRHVNSSPIMRGPNGVVQAVFNAVGQTIMVTSPMQAALERMLLLSAKHDATSSVIATIPQPVEASIRQEEAPLPADVSDDCAVSGDGDVKKDGSPAPAETQGVRTVAYLVAGDDDAIEAFRKSVERGIEPSRPVKKAHVAAVTAPVFPSVAVRSEPAKTAPSLQPNRPEQKETGSSPVAKPDVKRPTAVKVTAPASPVVVARPPVANTRPLPPQPKVAQSKVPVKTPVKPGVERVQHIPRSESLPVSRPDQSEISGRPVVLPVDNAVNRGGVDVSSNDYVPIDPETGEISIKDTETRRNLRDSLTRIKVAERESERYEDYKPTAAERRHRMNQLRAAARRVSPPSGRVVSEEEGLKKLMSIIR